MSTTIATTRTSLLKSAQNKPQNKLGAIALFPGGHGKPQLRPFPFTAHRDLPMCLLAGEQPSRAESSREHSSTHDVGSHPRSPAQARADVSEFSHTSVMLAEIVALFDGCEGFIVDATLGAGGHAEALLETHDDITVIGLDRDSSAIAAATHRLARFGDRFQAHHVRFDEMSTVVDPGTCAGVIFDLGVSSPQLDQGDRGFSHRFEGPLDMRMDDTESLTAADVVNTYTEYELIGLLRDNADERHAKRIASAIVAARPLATTAELADAVANAVPAAVRRQQQRHPAMRTFQAIRIEVNSELEVLRPALSAAVDALRHGGRLAVLSYHSGEDRIVKQLLRDESRTSPQGRPDLPPPPDMVTRLRLLWSGSRQPGDAELASNKRSASARLRAAERTEQG